MIVYGGPGLAFECGDFAVANEARDRHECIAAYTMKVIVMIAGQLQSGSPIVEDDLAEHDGGDQFFGRTKHRRKVAVEPALNEIVVQLVECPGMAIAVTHHSE